MKKIFCIIVALVVTFGVSAQTFQKNPAGKMNVNAGKNIMKAPALTDAGDITWSYYTGSASNWEGLGVNAKASFGVGIFVPGDVFGGTSLKAIRIPVLVSDMTSVSVWAKGSMNGTNVCSKSVSNGSFTARSFFEVAFDEPYTIPSTGLYVGYSFTSSESYPIAIAGDDATGGLLLEVNGEGFDDYVGNGFGVSPLQIVVGDMQLEDYNASFTELQPKTTLANAEFKTYAQVSNVSKNPVNSIDYTIDVDGKKEQKHINLSDPIPAGLAQKGIVEICGTSPADVKSYQVTISIDKVNGQPNAQEGSTSATFQNVSKAVTRRTVVEEYTGTGCGWCPRGWVGMERMKKNYPDTFIGIAFHQYNSSDPMYVANYYSINALGITGAPGCNMNRRFPTDPYYGSNNGIWYDLEAFNAELPIVDVKAKAQWNEDSTAVDIEAIVEPLTSGFGFTVAYVLTADSLSGTTNAWKQSNYYYQYSPSQISDDPELNQFGRGGAKGQSTVFLTFNDVMIGSSYGIGNKNTAEIIEGSDNAQPETLYVGHHQTDMPKKASLLNAINKNLVFANVLVISNATGEILNAARVTITEKDTPDPVDPELSYSETAFEVEEGSDFTAPTLNNPNNVPVTYTSSDVAVAQVDENTGVVTIGTPGTTTITASFTGNDEYLPASASYTLTVTEKQAPFVTEINVEREVGQGYDVTRFEPDFTEALAYLGIENPTDATLVGINADGSEEAAPNGPIDGWCDADGNFVGWHQGGDSRICVKFFPSVPQYEICDMNGADEVGKTYTVKYGLKANGKMAIFVINVTFIEKQEHIYKPEIVKTIEISHLEKAATAYCEEEPAPTFDVAEVCGALGIANMSEAKAYIVNLTDGNFVENTGSIDGWRNADGDAAPWAQCANGFCLKLNNPASGEFDYTGAHDDNFQVGDTYVAQWGIVANEKAVLLKVTITFVDDPTGINGINADAKVDTIYNMNGVRTKNMNQKGVYIQNGKKVLVK